MNTQTTLPLARKSRFTRVALISSLRPFRHARAIALACALALGTVAATPPADAHGFQPSYQLEGTWRVTVNTYNCTTLVANPAFVSYLTFGAGGSLVETTSNAAFQPGQRSSGHGFWERVGRNYYRAVSEAFIQFTTGAPLPPFARGSQRIDQGIQMTGRNSFETDATVTFFDPAGTVLVSGCARAVGNRLE
jgi:hypothetical protein